MAVTTVVCEQYPTTAASLSQVQLVFGDRASPARAGSAAPGGGEANDQPRRGRRQPLPRLRLPGAAHDAQVAGAIWQRPRPPTLVPPSRRRPLFTVRSPSGVGWGHE